MSLQRQFLKLKRRLRDAWDENALFASASDPLPHPDDDDVVTLDVPGYRQAHSYTFEDLQRAIDAGSPVLTTLRADGAHGGLTCSAPR